MNRTGWRCHLRESRLSRMSCLSLPHFTNDDQEDNIFEHPAGEGMIAETVQQILSVLYPLYKEEVYRRREQMMRLTVFGSLGLITLLVALLLSPQRSQLTAFDTLFIELASLIWCGLFCALILQQQYRHRQAKQVLVQLEQALGFYEEGLVVDHQALYPEEWKTAWLTDRTSVLYFTTLCSLTGLLLLALIFS